MPYTSQADIPKGAGIALANPGMAQMTGGQGLQAIGQSISKIAESQMNIRISREIAEGMAERNALISQYKLDLMKKDPRDTDFLAGYDKLQAQMKGIYKGKSLAAQDELNRRFTVLGSKDRADVAYMAYQRENQLWREELPAIIENYARNGQRDMWERDVDGLISRRAFLPSQKKSLMMDYDKVESKLMKDAVKQNFSLQMNELAKTLGWDAVLEMITKPETREGLLKSGLTADDIDNEYENIRTLANAQKAAEKLAKEDAAEAEKIEIDNIVVLPQSEFLASYPEAIDKINSSTNLTAADKKAQREILNNRFNSIKKGEVDPIDEFDPDTYNSLVVRISRNSKSVKDSEIASAVGRGANGGITSEQRKVLFDLKKKYDYGDVLGRELHREYASAIRGLAQANAFSDTKLENAQYAAKLQLLLDQWAIKNQDATAEDYEKFYNQILDTSNYSAPWDRFWFGLSREGERAARRENIDTAGVELGGAQGELTNLSDAELLRMIKGE